MSTPSLDKFSLVDQKRPEGGHVIGDRVAHGMDAGVVIYVKDNVNYVMMRRTLEILKFADSELTGDLVTSIGRKFRDSKCNTIPEQPKTDVRVSVEGKQGTLVCPFNSWQSLVVFDGHHHAEFCSNYKLIVLS
jgi:hypothetical protein